jgi:hypothetical protein
MKKILTMLTLVKEMIRLKVIDSGTFSRGKEIRRITQGRRSLKYSPPPKLNGASR